MLLATKLIAPSTSEDLVGRPRLTQELRPDQGRRVTLISAPAGSGKTTLLAEWIDRDQPSVAWLSLDRRDNSPDRFLEHLFAAIAKACRAPGKEPQTLSSPGRAESRLEELLNQLSDLDESLTLVLDDYHCIHEELVHRWVELLLEHQPARLHVVLSTREDPPLPIARWRVRRRLREIRTHDLRFTVTEASELLQALLGRPLEQSQVEALRLRTEGWAAGLQLAGLSLRTSADSRKAIEAFTGENRHVVDYLTDEVLAGLDAKRREFLLKTSILDALSAPLCRAMTGFEDSAEILEQLERSNLFVVALDQTRTWYRYHHLFSELLRSRLLTQVGVEDVVGLEMTAASWFAEAGEAETAIELAVSALERRPGPEQDQRVLSLLLPHLAQHGHGIFTRARRFEVEAWLDRVPEDVRLQHPGLALLTAKVYVINQRREEAGRYLAAAEQLCDSAPLPVGRQAALRGEIAVARASIALRAGQMDTVLREVDLGLQTLPGEDAANRSHAALSGGLANRWLGRLDSAASFLRSAADMAQTSGDALIFICASSGLARLALDQGRLAEAERCCRASIDLCRQTQWHDFPSMLFLRETLAEILWERNESEEAREQIRKALKPHEAGPDPRRRLRREGVEIVRALLGLLEGEARSTVPRAVPVETRILPILPPLDEMEARLCLQGGGFELVREWLDEEDVDCESPMVAGLLGRHLLLSRVLISESRHHEAIGLLGRLLATYESLGLRRFEIDAFVALALARHGLGQTRKAEEAVRQALDVAAVEGAIRPFVEVGTAIVPLLEALSNDVPTLVPRLLAALRAGGEASGMRRGSGSSRLTEPLSERELDVLQLIYGGLSNQEIADRLFVSLNTIKTHIRNIYGKIDAKSRGQAIARVRELGLL